MPRPLADRLLVRPGHFLLLLRAPGDWYCPETGQGHLRSLPAGVTVHSLPETGLGYDAVHQFAADKAAVDRDAPTALGVLRPGGVLWVCYPKKSGPAAGDLSRDVGWSVFGEAGWDAVAQIAIDETWSALRFRPVADVRYTPGATRSLPGGRGRP